MKGPGFIAPCLPLLSYNAHLIGGEHSTLHPILMRQMIEWVTDDVV